MADDNVQHGIDDNPEGDAAKGAALGGVGGAAVGAAAGAPAGPVGMAIGAVVGGIAGAVASGAAVAAVDSMDNDNTVTGFGDSDNTDERSRTTLQDRDATMMDTRADRDGLMETTGRDASMVHTLSDERDNEVRVPVVEEEARVRKEAHEAGAVTLRKETEVETRHISEPVSHTEVTVERRDIDSDEAYDLDPNATTLREGETLRVPVIKEELEVRKVPKVTGEVVVRTHQETEQVERDVQLRREQVEVDREGDVRAEGLDNFDEREDLDVDLGTTGTSADTRRSL